MDMNTLIDQILAKVSEKLAQAEPAVSSGGKPRLLILTPEHGEHCHELLESAALRRRYDTDCALLRDYQCDMADYETVILYGLSVEAMGKLACGVCDTAYTRLAQQALLMGRRVFVPAEEVALYRYAALAPAAYYAALEGQLRLLTDSGVVVCPGEGLEAAVLGGIPARVPAAEIAAPAAGMTLDKRVITERDIYAAKERGCAVLRVTQRAILTDLARDAAKARGVAVVRA